MSEEEEEKCEVCASPSFVAKFCDAIGGDKECRDLTERAGRGEMTQEKYYAIVIEKYGRDKVAIAMEKALVKDKMEASVTPAVGGIVAKAKVAAQPPGAAQVPGPQAPGGPQVQEKKELGEVEIPEEERKLATGIADDKEKHEMEERAKAGIPKFMTSLKGMCLPCIGEPATAILNTVKLWYTGTEKEKIENFVKQMRDGTIMVEDALKEVLMMSGGQDCVNSVLADFNKTMESAVDSALKEKPELQQGKKGK